MPAKIPQDVRERQLRELAEADGYTFVGWVDGYHSCESRVIFNCPSHGDWDVMCQRFTSGNRCRKCNSRLIPRSECEKKIADIAVRSGHQFVRFDGAYSGARGKAVIRCDESHEWSVSIYHFKGGTRCPVCEIASRSSKNRTPQVERERQISLICDTEDLRFVKWCGNYKSSRSRIILSCPSHGEWEISINNLVNHSRRCPGCGSYGYASNKSGTLYALISNCESMVKIGITNKIEQRHAQLASKTPFNFTMHRQLHCEDGSQPPMLERMFHDEFPSAGLTGFDGATEWRVWYPEVNTWFDLLGG